VVEFIPAVCPQCGGELQVPRQLEEAHCLYCGTKFIIDRKTEQHVHYHVNEATFICDDCGRRWPYSENSGVVGSTICMDCYYEARTQGWIYWAIGLAIFFIGFIPIIMGVDICIITGCIIIIIGVGIMAWGKSVMYQ
jgi:hypothetical protein